MSNSLRRTVVCLLVLVGTMAWQSRAGLYEDQDPKNVKSGDINDQDYWWTKYDLMMLDIAMKQHQPEGQIGLDLAITSRRLDDLVKKYPNDDELKTWQKKVNDTIAKIDPNAPRGQGFNPGCPWDESNFAQLWVNVHWAQMQIDANQMQDARGTLLNCQRNLDIMLAPDRMKNYPEDLRKWVEDSKPKVDDMMAKVKSTQ